MGNIFGCPLIILRGGVVMELPARVTILLRKKFLGVGRISTDIIVVPVAQLGEVLQPQRRATVSNDNSCDGTDIFIQAKYIPYKSTEVPDDISVLTDPLMTKFLKVAVQALMIHANLEYEDIRVVNNGACLN